MYPKTFTTINDAYELVGAYFLHHADLHGGTPDGLVAYLFLPGDTIANAADLSKRVLEYREEFAATAKLGRDFDARLAIEVDELIDALLERDGRRRRLAALVRRMKYGPGGGSIWSAIAELATTQRSSRAALVSAVNVPSYRIDELVDEVDRYCAFAGLPLGYEPGRDHVLDVMVRMDIERLDATLESPTPWDGKEEQSSYEIEALLGLARCQPERTPP